MSKLSRSIYFSKSELVCKCCGELPEEGMNEQLLFVIDNIRENVGPISLSCAYRCPYHNAEVGGVKNSQHVQGCAADILLPDGMTVDQLADIAEKCGADGIGRYYSDEFVHVDTRDNGESAGVYKWEG